MKIAVLMDAPLRATLISEKTMARLAEWGEVVVNETDKAERETVRAVLKDADIAITSWGVPQLDKDLLDCAPNLRLVAHAAGSVKGIVSDELYARGIRVISSARILSYGVSETALGLTICACKNVFGFNESIHRGGWVEDYSVITELYDITVGVVGCGFAGAHYIELLQAFGVNVLAYDPLMDEATIAKLGAKKVELDTLLRESDVVSLHAPALDSTYHMIDAAALSLMKENAILINTARGTLVDEAALVDALRGGKLKYACIDVTDPEPPAADSPLRDIPNCIMTPHLAGLANNGKRKIGAHVADEIARFLASEPLVSEITQAMLATIA
jgi:phosphoglycerate dehydrogenase-like enzyme